MENYENEINVTAPSNIALLKYWGKDPQGIQWPSNNSISMTLSNCHTRTSAAAFGDIREGSVDEISLEKIVEASSKKSIDRVQSFLNLLREETGYRAALRIKSENSFPAGAGIASSASGFAALTVAALAAWTRSKNWEELRDQGYGVHKLAKFARMGSGSACRSLLGGFVQWRKGDSPESQSISLLAPASHWDLSDLIAVVDRHEKTTSSSEGHKIAQTSPLFCTRVLGIPEKEQLICEAIEDQDLEKLGFVLESEALDMHAVMMSSTPSLNYLSPKTFEILAWVRESRRKLSTPAYFTLDAGSTVHILTETHAAETWRKAFQERWGDIVHLIEDRVGNGPTIANRTLEIPKFSLSEFMERSSYAD